MEPDQPARVTQQPYKRLQGKSFRRTTMTKLSLSAVSVGAALVCAALPFSVHWIPMKTPSVSFDQAYAQFVGQRPSGARNVAGVSRPVQRRTYRRAARRAAVGRRAARRAAVGRRAGGRYYG